MTIEHPLEVKLSSEDLYDIACLCHAALAQDSPHSSDFYFTSIMNMVWAYLPSCYKKKVEVYLAEKEYLPPVSIEISK